jgi:hypothetical protein
MPPTHDTQQSQKDGRLALSIHAIQNKQTKSLRQAARLYSIPETTLRERIRGTLPQATANAQKRKLHPTEAQALVRWILDLDQRGFPPYIIDVRRMADHLLAARGQDPPPQPVGKCWVSRFIKTQPELQTKWDRKLHSQRALCQDPVKISAWYKVVEETRQAYGIQDGDTYNFDETGFMMGVGSSSKVVTSADTVGRAIHIQPGNRDWVTTIEGICAAGWSIPPFIILAGKLHQAGWYTGLPAGWVLAVSDNGWTTDQLGLAWLEHFNRHTEARTVGTYRLLILDGHGSHATPEFDQYCAEHRIITLCMPAHTSHLLQPLDVSCFSPLKAAYGHEIAELARQGVFHIDKEEFLSIYPRVRSSVFTEQTIQSGFRATGLVPFCPERVLSCLTVIRTPSPPGTTAGAEAVWTAETPHTTTQLEQQARHVRELLQRQSQSPTSQAIRQLVKGCQLAMNSATILAEENRKLRVANQRKRQRQNRRRQYIATGGALQAEEGQRLAAEAERVLEQVAQEDRVGRPRAPPTCSNCHVQGHKRNQCTQRL